MVVFTPQEMAEPAATAAAEAAAWVVAVAVRGIDSYRRRRRHSDG